MIYSGSAAFGRLQVLGLFADNMVIQREEPIVIQGIALPQEAIRVTFHESIVSCHTDANMEARITCGESRRTLRSHHTDRT